MKDSVMRSTRLLQPAVAGSGEGATDLSLHFEGLANPTRLKIVERLAGAVEVTVSELALQCKVSQPRMSWHLRILRRAGVISTRRGGREVFCRLDRETIAARLDSFTRLLSRTTTAEAHEVHQPMETVQPVSEGA
ncbi:MAG: ArsR/SmtB family transcription factor [Candidatus Dormibacteria bacterium]